MGENDMPDVHLDLIRDPARKFPSVADPELVRSARVWHCKYKSLAPLSALCNLEELVIATFPDESFEFLGKLSELRFLQILHMPKICDIFATKRAATADDTLPVDTPKLGRFEKNNNHPVARSVVPSFSADLFGTFRRMSSGQIARLT
jgi:hypothetical protein